MGRRMMGHRMPAITPRRIYVASSWRNAAQPAVVTLLREAGHEVYDFRHPAPGNDGFRWSEMDGDWRQWTPQQFASMLRGNRIAYDGFAHDRAALDWCNTCVLLLPCGKSAHLEAGYAAGQGKRVIVYLHAERFEPELMYLLAGGFVFDDCGLLSAVAQIDTDFTRMPNRGA